MLLHLAQLVAELAWLACPKMPTYDPIMDTSVTQFRATCLELIRRVEIGGEAIDIKRRGKVVARLAPPATAAELRKPWERLRGSGELLAGPGESVLDERVRARRARVRGVSVTVLLDTHVWLWWLLGSDK